jgi:site-specific recombinase XerD
MGAAEVEAFLSHWATDRGVSAATQNQALCALLFLYRKVLKDDMDWVENITRAKPSEHVPIVLTRHEVAMILGRMSGRNWLMASLMYGTEMRLTECLRLRIQYVDFGYRQITVLGRFICTSNFAVGR